MANNDIKIGITLEEQNVFDEYIKRLKYQSIKQNIIILLLSALLIANVIK